VPRSTPIPINERRPGARGRGDAPRDARAVRPVREAEQEDPARDPDLAVGIDDAGRLADTIAAHLPLKLEQKQEVLEMFDVGERLEKLLAQIETELDILQVEKRIRGRVKRQMEKSQREYYLNEQVKAIQKELGEGEEGADIDEIEKKIKAARHAQGSREEGRGELKKLKLMSPMSAEATVVRNYIDALIGLPWKQEEQDQQGPEGCREGARRGPLRPREGQGTHPRVPRRAAARRQGQGADPVPGRPPGVGKTSLGQSIAGDQPQVRAHGARRRARRGRDPRPPPHLHRLDAGQDPAEHDQGRACAIRCSCSTKSTRWAWTSAAIPSSALLEVLDPEQNHTFVDHYVEVEYDLSDVMFVATANTLNIPPALLDRMEVIRLSGYTEDEKVNIAQRYLLPKQMKNNGLKPRSCRSTESAMRDIVRYYTREAGVRSLEREISKICRKVVKALLLKRQRKKKVTSINARNLDKYLGVRRLHLRHGREGKPDRPGHRPGLDRGRRRTADDRGGAHARQGQDHTTGKLGEVMQESIKAR
jgi:ATP-dependent Lon protease